MSRKEWLLDAIFILQADFQHTIPLPEHIEILDCWPDDIEIDERKNCWGSCNTDADHPCIFISPALSDSIEVLETLVHELVHASVGCIHFHDLLFQIPASCIGLEGPLDATYAGEKLLVRLGEIVNMLGMYPGETT
jgi:hypothetical protein